MRKGFDPIVRTPGSAAFTASRSTGLSSTNTALFWVSDKVQKILATFSALGCQLICGVMKSSKLTKLGFTASFHLAITISWSFFEAKAVMMPRLRR